MTDWSGSTISIGTPVKVWSDRKLRERYTSDKNLFRSKKVMK